MVQITRLLEAKNTAGENYADARTATAAVIIVQDLHAARDLIEKGLIEHADFWMSEKEAWRAKTNRAEKPYHRGFVGIDLCQEAAL